MSLSDDLIKHQIFIQRLAGTEYKSIKVSLDELHKAAKILINAQVPDKFLKDSLRNATKGLRETSIQNMKDFAEYESKFSAKTISKYIEGTIIPINADKLEKALITNNMGINNINRAAGTRKSLDMAYKQFGNRKSDEIAQVIKDGRVLGLTNEQIAAKVAEKINGLQSTQARTLASTSVNYTTTLARAETIKANKDISNKVIWVSVLDDATTDYCAEHDGRIYEIGDAPQPPAHWNCRSMLEPYFGDEEVE